MINISFVKRLPNFLYIILKISFKKTHLKGVLLPRLLVVTLHNLAIDPETQHMIADFIVVGDRRDFRRQATIQRMLHRRAGQRAPRFRRSRDMIVVLSDHLRHHYRRCRAFAFTLVLIALLENSPLGLSARPGYPIILHSGHQTHAREHRRRRPRELSARKNTML